MRQFQDQDRRRVFSHPGWWFPLIEWRHERPYPPLVAVRGFSKEGKVFSERRLLAGGIVSALIVAWTFVALGTPKGFPDLLIFVGPAGLLAIAVAWLFFTFAGNLFTWSRAAKSVIVGVAVLTPVLAYFFSTSKDQNLMTKFLFMVVMGWAASLGGTLWSLAGAAHDAFREWRDDRRASRPRRLYVAA